MNRNRNHAVCDAGILHNTTLRQIRRRLRLQRNPSLKLGLIEQVLGFFGVVIVSRPAKSIRPRRTLSTR